MPIDYFLSSYEDALNAISLILTSDEEVQKHQISNELIEKIQYYITQAHSEFKLKRYFQSARWYDVILNIFIQLPENDILQELKDNLYDKTVLEAIQTHSQILETQRSLIHENYKNHQYKQVLQNYYIYLQAIHNISFLSQGSELINNTEHFDIQILVANSHFKENEVYLATLMSNMLVLNYFNNPILYMQISLEKLREITNLIGAITLLNQENPQFITSPIALNFQYFNQHVFLVFKSLPHSLRESTSNHESTIEETDSSINDESISSTDTPTKLTYLEAALKGLKYQEALKEYREQLPSTTKPPAKKLVSIVKPITKSKTHHLRGSNPTKLSTKVYVENIEKIPSLYNLYDCLALSDDEMEEDLSITMESKSTASETLSKHRKIKNFDQTLEDFRTDMVKTYQNKIRDLIKSKRILEALEEYEYSIKYAKGLKFLSKLIKEKENLLNEHYKLLRNHADEYLKQYKYIKAYKTVLTLKNYAKFFVKNQEKVITELESEEATLKKIITLYIYITKYNQLILSGDFLKAHKILDFISKNTDKSILEEPLHIKILENSRKLGSYLIEPDAKLYTVVAYEGDVPVVELADLSKDPLKAFIEPPKFDFLFQQQPPLQTSRTNLRIADSSLNAPSQVSSLTVFGFIVKQASQSTRELSYFCNHIIPICQYIPQHPVIDFLKKPLTLFSINLISLYSIKDLVTNHFQLVGDSALFYLKMHSENKIYTMAMEEYSKGKDITIRSYQDFISSCGEPIAFSILKNILNVSIFKNAFIVLPHAQYIFALNIILDATSTGIACYSFHNNNAPPSSYRAKSIAYGVDAITATSLIAYFSSFNKEITPLIEQIDQKHHLYTILYTYEATAVLKNTVITHQISESLASFAEKQMQPYLLNSDDSQLLNETISGSLIDL